jgi:ribokinase
VTSPGPARICVIGSITMDLVARAPRLPQPGETVLGSSFQTFPGGKGANQAVAAARMGAEVTLIGAVGDDAYGREILECLKGHSLDLSPVAVRSGTHTGTSLIGIGENGENSIIAVSGANWTVSPADIDAARAIIAAADILLLQLEIPIESVLRAAAIAQDSSTTVMLNAAPGRALPADLLTATDVLLVNRSEADLVSRGKMPSPTPVAISPGCHQSNAEGERTGTVEPADIDAPTHTLLNQLAALHINHSVLTLGARGCAWVHKNTAHLLDAFAVEAIDTVGAGDAFCGVLATRWAENQIGGGGEAGLIDALHWAAAAGALATTRPGAIPSMPTRAEIRALLTRR